MYERVRPNGFQQSIILGLGCIAFNVSATFATVLVFGWVLLISSVVAVVQAFQTGTWRGLFLYLLNAVFRGVTGYMLIRYPLMGAETLTIMLSSFLYCGRRVSSGWFCNGEVSSVGLVRVLRSGLDTSRSDPTCQMPISGLRFIGFAIGVDLISTGIAEIGSQRRSTSFQAAPRLALHSSVKS